MNLWEGREELRRPRRTQLCESRSFYLACLARNAAHLFALSGLALTGPLLNLLGGNPAFFAAHEMSRWEVIGFALVVALVPALVLTAIEALLGLASHPARDIVHLVFVALLAAVAALQFVRNL